MKHTIKNYGLKRNEVDDPRAYRKFGGIELPKIVLQADSQWSAWTPVDELQHTPDYDTYGCTIYGTENIQQTLERRVYGKTSEYDERFNYNTVKVNPPGADPHDAAESFRNDGVVSGLLPMTSTYEEYAKPRPMPTSIVSKGIAHPYELRHQWLWERPIEKVIRTATIKEYLKYSPLGVSVTAWKLGPDGTYIDSGKRNTHWTMLYGYNDKGWLIYDSYAPHRKVLSFDHNIECCKRYQLVPSTRKEQLSIFAQILQKLAEWLGLIEKQQTPTPAPIVAPEPVLPQPETPKPIITVNEMCEAIKTYEGYIPPNAQYPNGSTSYRFNNPGNIKGIDGKFLKFNSYSEGFLYLVNYVYRVRDGKHKAYPKGGQTTLKDFFRVYAPVGDNNKPDLYSVFVAKRLSTPVTTKLIDLV